jgi:aminocarboxymuconate-semialdehyde decarboxylase
MVVDAHAHVIVPGLGAQVTWDAQGQLVSFGGHRLRAAPREFVRVERILEEQDAAGVDLILLCPWINVADRDRERQNEVLASYVGERVAVLGTVDCGRPDELQELMHDGRLSGVEIPGAPGGDYLGHERFEDFWAAAEETGAFVFVHPSSRGFAQPVLQDYYLWNTLGNPTETAITAAHMVVSGVLERHPKLVVMLAHGGGALPWLRGRLRRAHEVQPAVRERLRESPELSLTRFYYDTVTHDPDVLRGVVEFVGADHVLCGSDYPFDMGVERPAEIVRALGLPPDEEDAVLGGNALRLLKRGTEVES